MPKRPRRPEFPSPCFRAAMIMGSASRNPEPCPSRPSPSWPMSSTEASHQTASTQIARLYPREMECPRLVASGLTSRRIGGCLAKTRRSNRGRPDGCRRRAGFSASADWTVRGQTDASHPSASCRARSRLADWPMSGQHLAARPLRGRKDTSGRQNRPSHRR